MATAPRPSNSPAASQNGNDRGSHRIVPELDGVRGIAILLVLLTHYTGAYTPKPLHDLLGLGWCGVDLFFVLSGFLITGILLDTKHASNYFSSFYIRRVLRIFPLYIAVIALYFGLVLPLGHHYGRLASLSGELAPWYWSHLSNWKSAFGFDVIPFTHFWSLAVEEQFYLIWPLLIFLTPRRFFPYVCAVVMVFPLALRCFFAGQGFHEYFLHRLTPLRMDSLAFGAFGAWLVRSAASRLVHKLSLILFAAGLFAWSAVVYFGREIKPFQPPTATFGFTFLAILFSGVVLFAYADSGSVRPASRLLRAGWLRAFGKYSYGIYVFHFPLMMLVNPFVERALASTPEPYRLVIWFPGLLASIALCFGVALVSWNLLEKHFLNMKGRFTAKKAPGAVTAPA